MLYVCSQQGDIYNRSVVTEKTNTDVTFSVASVLTLVWWRTIKCETGVGLFNFITTYRVSYMLSHAIDS